MRSNKNRSRPLLSRGGTTLTEVLMSLLCMGIGVVAVASLFPIALLRSVQATQLTSATILRFNAETLIDLYAEIPQVGDTYPTNYRNLVQNPDFDDNYAEHFGKKFLVDPLGAMIVRDDNGRPLGTTDKVGRLDRFDALPVFHNTPAYFDTTIPAADRPALSIKQAENLVTLPDSWVDLYDEIPVNNDADSITLPSPSEIDLADLNDIISAGGEVRILLFSTNGKMSESRLLTTASFATAGEITWTTALPSNNEYFPDKVERIWLQVKERRFTWLLTVRSDAPASTLDPTGARARVDVVVFFRRSPSFTEETPYELSGSGRNYVVSKLNQATWNRLYPSSDPNSPPYPNPYPDPFLKKGGFMLDTSTGEWHRLQKVNSNTFAISLERNSRTLNAHHAVFMKGVVDVYPLGSKP